MLDLRFVRENPDVVKENIKKKFQDQKLPLVDEVIELDARCRAAKKEGDDIRADRNRIHMQKSRTVVYRLFNCLQRILKNYKPPHAF